MFWKLVLAATAVYLAALYFNVSIGGFVHVIPVIIGACVLVRRMAKQPNSEFGRWRAPSEREGKRY